METRFVQEMHRFISQHTMIEDGETVLVAVSGGADSLTLLYGLHALHTQLNCHLHVVHLDHGLRQDSTVDAEFVREHAERLGIPFTGHTVELSHLTKQWKLSVEAAGRRARYEFYESVCVEVGATKVALGHHRDDIAETVLMNLLRGTGTSGLKGIAPIRDGKFIRPLAAFTRQEIESFLKSMGLVPRWDSTNTDKRYLRNRIRHELIPLLEQDYNPNIRAGLSRTAEVLSAESDYLNAIAQEAFDACRFSLSQSKGVVLDREKFQQNHIALQRRILRHGIAEIFGQVDDFYFEHFQAILGLINRDNPNAVLTLPNNIQFRRAYQQLIFEKIPVETADFTYPLNVPGKTLISALKAEITAYLKDTPLNSVQSIPDGTFEAMFDFSKIQLPLTVRNRRQGDRFQPHGMQGTKKIKDFLIDAKVAHCERNRIPLLVDGDEILWVIGFTTSERFKIQPQTQRCLHVHYGKNETVSQNRSDF
ncbi:MAG: tRNA lysidine(34) synthetase TilS [Candidatus Poribacteria bacterium]|nr:tRNA lysidine(34) synthetase TilS [Candidatus Poribacteria bacterium]